ncbi:MAG: hypothetical protein WB994_21225 [Candidatus Acidiferrum sp.]
MQITYKCPECREQIDACDLQQPAGLTGGLYCPKCQGRVVVSPPFRRAVGILSLFLATGILLAAHVKIGFMLLLGVLVLWVPISLVLNAYSTRFRPATLKKWKPRRRLWWSFEHLYERDEPPEIFGKRP